MAKEIKIEQGKIPKELSPGYEWKTLGGTIKRIKKGKKIKIEPGKNAPRHPLRSTSKGLGAALRGGGRAFNRGGKV